MFLLGPRFLFEDKWALGVLQIELLKLEIVFANHEEGMWEAEDEEEDCCF